MLDINLIRQNPEKVKEALLKRLDNVSFDELLAWDQEKRTIGTKRDEMKNQRNVISKKIPLLKKEGKDVAADIEAMQKLGEEILALDQKFNELEQKIYDFLIRLPAIPDNDVLAGGKENNEIIRTSGEKPEFAFPVKDHVKLATDLGLIDYERGVKISGAGHWIYTGIGAQLEWALLNYFIDNHIKDGWQFMLVPHMLNYQCGLTAGQFPKFEEDVYWLDNVTQREQFLLPTAETALANVHLNEILKADELPKKYFGFTPCYRKEAGSSRVEERGTVRGHQFNKVEMFQYVTQEKSDDAFLEMVNKAEFLVKELGLHFQTSKLAAEDCSAGMCKTYDIEVWIPSMNQYKEVSSISNSRDYQARRGMMRYRDAEGNKEYMHTLNASGLATSRLLPAILEQYQQNDGSIIIPEVLRPYMNNMTKIK